MSVMSVTSKIEAVLEAAHELAEAYDAAHQALVEEIRAWQRASGQRQPPPGIEIERLHADVSRILERAGLGLRPGTVQAAAPAPALDIVVERWTTRLSQLHT